MYFDCIHMNKTLKYSLTTAWIIFSRAYDAHCTAQLTPDLSKEANPLVTVVGISTWTPLLAIISLLTLYAMFAYFQSTYRPMDLAPQEKGFRFSEFATYMYLGRKDHWSAFLFKFPKEIKRFNQYMGHTLTPSLAYAGIISTIMWQLIHHSEWYRSMHNAKIVYAVLITGCLIIAYNWNRKMYRAYFHQA
jgi:hypothetical protein